MTEEQAKADIERRYGRPDFCFVEDADGQLFSASYAAVRVPKRWWNDGPAYHVHRVSGGRLGPQVEVVEFLEVRYVGA